MRQLGPNVHTVKLNNRNSYHPIEIYTKINILILLTIEIDDQCRHHHRRPRPRAIIMVDADWREVVRRPDLVVVLLTIIPSLLATVSMRSICSSRSVARHVSGWGPVSFHVRSRAMDKCTLCPGNAIHIDQYIPKISPAQASFTQSFELPGCRHV